MEDAPKRVKPKGLLMKRSETYGRYQRAFTEVALMGYGISLEVSNPNDYSREGNDIFIRPGSKLELFLSLRSAT